MAEIVPNKVPCGNNKGAKKPEVTSVPVKQIHGITYFKLQSDYPGDYTKNCGLLGNEIDENFFFLRSNDIKTGYTEEIDTRRYLVLVKVDDEEIRIDITDNDGYKFRVEDGYITITFPDGHEEKMGDAEGNPVRFLVEGDNVHIVTDSSLQGDGSYGNPVGVDLAYRTGTYAPADFYADLTCTGVTLNDIPPVGYGHAVITKEDVSRFGALYTWDQAHKIDEALAKEGRGWRLPTKEDWAKLLNWAEVNEDAKNHDTDKSGNFGCIAGNRLKSREFWETITDPDTKPVDDFGFSIYPVGVCPENYNTREPEEYDFTGLYKVTSFWTSSICDRDGEPYVRTFSYGHNDVAQFTENRKKRLSIRLVRDIDGDFDIADYAEILGDYVPVKLTTDGKQLWTSINISAFNYDGFNQNEVTVPEEWKDIDTDVPAVAYFEKVESGDSFAYVWIDEYAIPSTAIVETVEEIPEPTEEAPEYIKYEYTIHFDMLAEAKFFYNAWDGNRWHKKVIREGESVIILHEDYETGCDTAATPYVTSANTNHEWRLFVNEFTGLDELIDTLEALKKEFQKEFDELNEKIDDLSATTEEFSAATVEEIARLDERIDDEEARAISAETELHERINALELASAETPDETVLASYILREGPNGDQKGVRIDIPRDKYIKSISTGWSGAVIDEITGEFTYDPESGDTEVVRVVYQKNDGKFELVEIDIEYFIQEDEFASGVTVDEETHIVHGVVDPESEDFLTVGGNGFKLSGVQEAIDAAAQELWEALSAETAERIAADEELWDALSAETAARELADKELWDGIHEEASARTEADEYLQEQIDELKAKTIDPADDSVVIEVSGSSTTIRVQISETEDHLKLSDGTVVDYVDAAGHEILIPKGLYIDQDFGEFGE